MDHLARPDTEWQLHGLCLCQQICSGHPPLGAQNMYWKVVNGSPGSPSSGSSHTSRKAHWPLPTLGSFSCPSCSLLSSQWDGENLYKHPSVSVMGQGRGGKGTEGLTMRCSQWPSVIHQSGPWTQHMDPNSSLPHLLPRGVGAATGHTLGHLGFGLSHLFKASIGTFLEVPVSYCLPSVSLSTVDTLRNP